MAASRSTGPRPKQRAELTFRHNRDRGRHGWLRLTPAYSVRLVEERLHRGAAGARVLDPFCGTATTALAAAMRNQRAVALDINPFLVWLGNAKLARYGPRRRARALALGRDAADAARRGRAPLCEPPAIHNIHRWWSERTLEALCALKGMLDAELTPGSPERDLTLIAFCRTAIERSHAAFNHQSMSFKEPVEPADAREETLACFRQRLEQVLASAERAPAGGARVMLGDARELEALETERFDLVLTSPPYPNRMSYIRELRPYMYWTGHLQQSRDAGEIDWRAIGGTWGVATSRLGDWKRDASVALPETLEQAVDAIGRSDKDSGGVLARYVARYFEDMARHLRRVVQHLAPGARAHYIVGNSKFYDVVVPTQDIFGSLMRRAGFERVRVETIRKRNSKKELFEYDVVGEVS